MILKPREFGRAAVRAAGGGSGTNDDKQERFAPPPGVVPTAELSAAREKRSTTPVTVIDAKFTRRAADRTQTGAEHQRQPTLTFTPFSHFNHLTL